MSYNRPTIRTHNSLRTFASSSMLTKNTSDQSCTDSKTHWLKTNNKSSTFTSTFYLSSCPMNDDIIWFSEENTWPFSMLVRMLLVHCCPHWIIWITACCRINCHRYQVLHQCKSYVWTSVPLTMMRDSLALQTSVSVQIDIEYRFNVRFFIRVLNAMNELINDIMRNKVTMNSSRPTDWRRFGVLEKVEQVNYLIIFKHFLKCIWMTDEMTRTWKGQ